MKLLFTRFPLESTHGGAEMQTISLMKGLKERGHAVAFLGSCPTLLVVCQQHSIPCAELQIGEPPVTKFGVISFFWRRKAMREKLHKTLDQFVEHGLNAVFMLSLSEKILMTDIAVEKGLKVFWIEHDTIGRWLKLNPFRRTLRKLSSKVTTIGVSDLSAEMYKELGWDPAHTIGIPNGIDSKRFEKLPQHTETSIDPTFHVGTVARLSEEKGVDVLIEAIKDVPNCKLTIIGVGKMKDELDGIVKKHALEDRVTIENYWGDIGKFYQFLDLFVLPSRRHDPFGMVAAEAMTLGVPTIVTDVCGIAREIESGTDGIVCKADSVESLQKAIKEMVENPEKNAAIGKAGQRKAQEKFTMAHMLDRYEALLR